MLGTTDRSFWRDTSDGTSVDAARRRKHFAPRKTLVSVRQRGEQAYWGVGIDRVALLQRIINVLRQRHCGQTIDTGWSDYDLEVFCNAWTVVKIRTVQEELGSERCVVRVAYHLPQQNRQVTRSASAIATGLCASLNLGAATVVGSLSLLGIGCIWWRGNAQSAHH